MKLRTQIKADNGIRELSIDLRFKSKDGSSRYEAQTEFNSSVDAIFEGLLKSYHVREISINKV